MEGERTSSREAEVQKEAVLFCALHPSRRSVAVCEECGSAACLECAIPVRGGIRCIRCATAEVGEASPAPVPQPTPRPMLMRAILVAFSVGLLSSIPPWHRFGILTSPLSAWTFESGPWPPLASAAFALGSVLDARAWLRRSPSPANLRLALAGTAAAASALALATAPAYVSSSPAPFVALGSGLLGIAAGALARRPRAQRRRSP